ncbi:MAG: PAS domain S-box protein, partial [Candidatus Hydrothermarchaeales archaeon]
RIMKGETIRNQRTKVYNSAGELVDINLTLSPLRDRDGRPMGTVGVAKDIRHVIKAEEEISVLSEIAKEVSKTVQLDKVFGAISKYLERIIPYDRATIALVDEESKEFYVAAIVTRRKAVVMKGARIPFSDAILTKVVEDKREIIRSDLSKEEDLYPIDKKLQKEGVRSYLLVPLIVEGKAIGTLNFGSYQSDTYTEEHVRLAREVANLVSIAVDKSRLFEKLVKSELETKETKEYLEKLIETSPYCIISTDLEGRIVSFNKAAEETYGCKAEEAIGKHARILQPKDVPKELNKEIYEAMLKREGWEGELFNIRKNGEVFPIYLHTRRIVDERGNPIGLLSLAQDITERKKAEEEIKRLKEFNENIVQSMKEGILIEDPDGIITFVNPKTEELLGYSKEELVGKHWKDISSPEYIEKMREETAKRPKGISSSYEAAAVTKDGRTIPIIISATPLFENERYKGVLSVFTDITERKKLEEDLREHAKQLEHSNRIKDLFTDIMRHDLLTPICIIQNASELLLESNISKGATEEELQMLKRNAIKLQEMIDDATKYAKLESMGEFDFKERDISMIIEGVARDLKSFADEKGIVVENRIEGEQPASVSPFIREVFLNLLSNAIKFSPKGGRVVIDMEDEGKDWKVAVKDNGRGVPDRYKESIFLRFERVSKEGVVGTGLGLAIVKRIVELHNGKVWVEDNPEGGSIFYVQLPKKREAA